MINKKLAFMAIPVLAAVLIGGSLAPAFAGIEETAHFLNKSRGASAFYPNGDFLFWGYGQDNTTPNAGPPVRTGFLFVFDASTFCADLITIDKTNFEWGYDGTLVVADTDCGSIVGVWVGNSSTETIHDTFRVGDNCADGRFSLDFNGQSQTADSMAIIGGDLVSTDDPFDGTIQKGSSKFTLC